MWEQTLAIAFVLALLIGALWLLRRKGLATAGFALSRRAGASRRIELVERISLTPQHSLHLVRIEDRLVLIGVSPSSCAQLDSFRMARSASEQGFQ